MAKRAQIASLAISRGGGKKTIFATGGTSGAEKYSPERRKRRGEAGRGRGREKEERKRDRTAEKETD